VILRATRVARSCRACCIYSGFFLLRDFHARRACEPWSTCCINYGTLLFGPHSPSSIYQKRGAFDPDRGPFFLSSSHWLPMRRGCDGAAQLFPRPPPRHSTRSPALGRSFLCAAFPFIFFHLDWSPSSPLSPPPYRFELDHVSSVNVFDEGRVGRLSFFPKCFFFVT